MQKGSVDPGLLHGRTVAGYTTETKNRQTWPQSGKTGRAIEKRRAKAKAKAKVEESPKAQEKAFNCCVCGGTGHTARLCASEGWVNDLEQDAPEGEDTNEEGCWTDEDDETPQLGYVGYHLFSACFRYTTMFLYMCICVCKIQ